MAGRHALFVAYARRDRWRVVVCLAVVLTLIWTLVLIP